MKIQQWHRQSGGWCTDTPDEDLTSAQLMLVFGSTECLSEPDTLAGLRERFPKAHFFGCSTSGEIAGTRISDDSVVATAVAFARVGVEAVSTRLEDEADSYRAGGRLAAALPSDGLRHVLVVSDGLAINGSQLVEGLAAGLPAGVAATGGLAGDGTRFARTVVVAGAETAPRIAAAVGLYGEGLRLGYGSLGGWDCFGPERLVTRARANVLYELDGRSALALYKQYLGDHARGLPASGLLFPLSVLAAGRERPLVRTILSIDEAAQSMTFAGDVPIGSRVRLMRANVDRLVEGAFDAGVASATGVGRPGPTLSLLVSCVGRRLVLKQRCEEEVEAVRDVLGPGAWLTGFYSYGEISPFTPDVRCELHNQTMTVTTLAEDVG